MILLFTDFGFEGPYVGQMKAVLAEQAPGEPVIDLMHDAPRHDPRSAAYILAALVPEMPPGAVCVAVVDPGVGGDRPPVIVEADGRWFTGPGEGLFEILQRQADSVRQWRIADWPDDLPAIIYIDRFGNAVSGLRAISCDPNSVIRVGDVTVRHARVFSDVQRGQVFWYENSSGMVEIAVNCGAAADVLNLSAGSAIDVETPLS